MEKTPYSFGVRCLKWALHTFNSNLIYNRKERTLRFIEEAVELAQACGLTQYEVEELISYVYRRPVGEIDQEFGGVMNTLFLLAETEGKNLHNLSEIELSRCWDNVEKIKAKQKEKAAAGVSYDFRLSDKNITTIILDDDGRLPEQAVKDLFSRSDIDPLGR